MTLALAERFSLKTRVTLFTLLIFLISLWSLTLYAARMLRVDLQELLGQQQFSVASLMAAEVQEELSDRLTALETVGAGIDASLMDQPTDLQATLERYSVVQALFNGGTVVTDRSGTAIATIPLASRRVGVNYMELDHVATALLQGRSNIGKPVMGKVLVDPLISLAVPLRSSGGEVIGALVGVINLNQKNFLDKITSNRLGKTGGYLVVAPQHRLIVTATDKSRIMEALPPPGESPVVDRFVQGNEGPAIFVDARGVEVLASVKSIPVSGWLISAVLPTSEVFGPIWKVQQRVLLAATLLSLLAGALTWWMLKRQLAPMLDTVGQLAAMSVQTHALQPLQTRERGEVGQLIGGFNRLIETLVAREACLREREAFSHAILNSMSAEIAVLDRHGVILAVNQPWRRFAAENQGDAGSPTPHTDIGVNYLSVCQVNADDLEQGNPAVLQGIQGVLDGTLPRFSLEYPCHSPTQQRWFSLSVTPLGPERQGVVISHNNITERIEAQMALQNTLNEKEALLKEVHHRVKNNLQVISSLLRLESARSAAPDTRNVLGAMQNRIRAMAMLHDSLYRSGTYAAVDLGAYLRQLATQAFRSFNAQSGAIELQLELASVTVGMDQAMPCGLIVSELLSNSLKHAFPGGRTGTLRVELQLGGGGRQICLCVGDDGVGLGPDFDARSGRSLGLQLVYDLALQLGGPLLIGPGSLFTVTFATESPNPAPLKRPR